MSATIKALYGANNQAITITFTSLANAAARSGAAIDNTVNLFLDALLSVTVKTNAAGTLTTGIVSIFVYGTTDGGSTYGGGETGMGTNAGVTLTSPPNLALLAVIATPANATVYSRTAISVAQAFGGVLPDHWGILVVNNTGATLDASVGSANFQGLQAQSV